MACKRYSQSSACTGLLDPSIQLSLYLHDTSTSLILAQLDFVHSSTTALSLGQFAHSNFCHYAPIGK